MSANLSKTNSPSARRDGPAAHNLYVLVGGFVSDKSAVGGDAAAASDLKGRELTLEILQYVHARLAVFARMGVKVQVHKVPKASLGDARLVDAMKRRGIASLPALTTATKAYVGARAIREVYDKNIAEFEAFQRRGLDDEPAGAPADEDDDGTGLAAHYRSEVLAVNPAAGGGGDDDDDDESLGEGGGKDRYGSMMSRYRQRMQQRDSGGSARRPEAPPAAGWAASAPAARRDNNVAPSATDALIDSMAGDIDAISFAGDGDGDGDTKSNAQDDIMSKAYWANQELTM